MPRAAATADLAIKALGILADAIETRTAAGSLKSLIKTAISEAIKSAKPMLVVVNVSEGDVAKAKPEDFGLNAEGNLQGVVVSAPIELEISRLSPEEQKEFLADLGLAEPSLDRVIRAS